MGAEVRLSEAVGLFGFGGVQRLRDGRVQPRDLVVTAPWTPIREPTAVVRLQPGLSIPTGGIGTALAFTPLSTSSVDPWLAADAVLGGTALALLSATARVPLYKGWDSVRQGAFVRADARTGYRFGAVVPWFGASVAHQAEGSHRGAAPQFTEVALTAGTIASIGARWGLVVQARFPAWVGGAERTVSGGVTVRHVIGTGGAKAASD